MTALPSGIVTFLFTDIERSTEQAGALGDERWAALLAEHRRRLRGAFSAHRGREVHAEGDAFLVAFERATDAVAAAIAGQRALESDPWPNAARVRVRMGLHTGEALVRDGDYVGHEVHLAKRICDVGHGGQVVVSTQSAELVRRQLADGVWLADLGRHRLKDLRDAQQLFQLCASGLRTDFPSLRSLGGFRSNLPAQRSTFVGREKELAIILTLLADHRLVTLTGIGGCGKTRLALQAARARLGSFRDGVFFVDLAPISDPELIVTAVSAAAGISIGGAFGGATPSITDLLLDYLAARHCLLVIDNCEHLLDATADLVDRVLARCPEVVICATSREALEVEGEQTYRVPSLTIPADTSEVDTSEAVQLFQVRARATKPDFQITPDNRQHLAEICRRLDGIPLAIEFAAARMSHLSPRQIAERLDDAFCLLTGGRRRIERQQTLEAALDWSHDLLGIDEQTLFRRLAVFAGSFDLTSAERVCSDEVLRPAPVLDLLGSLVAKSLVTTEGAGGELRYRMLETVRLYASKRLIAAGEVEALRGRHRDWYVRWLETLPFECTVFDHSTIARVAQELDNMRVAADWSIAEHRPDLLARLACRPLGVWWFTDRSDEGHRWVLKAVERPDILSAEQLMICYAVLSLTSMLRAEGAAADYAARAIALARGVPTAALVVALGQRAVGLATSSVLTRDHPKADEARRTITEAIATARSRLDRVWLAYAHHMSGQVELTLGDTRCAAEHLGAAVDACDERDAHTIIRVWALSNLSVCQHLCGDTENALRSALRARHVWDRVGETIVRVAISIETTPSLAAAGHREVACAKLRDALRDTSRVEPLYPNTVFILTAAVATIAGRFDRAGRLLAAGRYLGGAAELPVPFRSPPIAALYRHYVVLVREALGFDAARYAKAEGRAMAVDDAIAYALDTLDP
jgi:predicted ATPase/class 3 adenylate cyclase